MIELEFKVWLERFASTHYPTQMYPANRAGVRDVRFGYSMNTSDSPSVLTHVGSDVVTGMGSVYSKSKGTAFPNFGSGYRNYFDELTAAFQDGKNYVVSRDEPYDETKDDGRQSTLKDLTKNALHHIRHMSKIEADASRLGIDIRNNPETIYEPSQKGDGFIRILFRFHPPENLSDRLRMRQIGAEEE